MSSDASINENIDQARRSKDTKRSNIRFNSP